MTSASPTTNHLQRGYPLFSGNTALTHSWVSPFGYLTYEPGLGVVMFATEEAPEALADGSLGKPSWPHTWRPPLKSPTTSIEDVRRSAEIRRTFMVTYHSAYR